MLGLLLGTIAATAPVSAMRTPPIIVAPRVAAAGRATCRAEFGTASLVQRYRICHTAADWRVIDARHRLRRRQGG